MLPPFQSSFGLALPGAGWLGWIVRPKMNYLRIFQAIMALPFLLTSCTTTGDRAISECLVHKQKLLHQSGFFAQDGSVKPSRDLRPLLEISDNEYPNMTPWDFAETQSETHPRPGEIQYCRSCDNAVAQSLGRSYPEE